MHQSSSPVKDLKLVELKVLQPSLHLDAMEELCSGREQVTKQRPQRTAGGLARDTMDTNIDSTLDTEVKYITTGVRAYGRQLHTVPDDIV